MASFELALHELDKFNKIFKAFEEAKNAITILASIEQNKKVLEKEHTSLLKAVVTQKEELTLLLKQQEQKTLDFNLHAKLDLDLQEKKFILLLKQQEEQWFLNKEKLLVEQELLSSTCVKLKGDQEKLKQSTLIIEEEYIVASKKLESIRKQIATLMGSV